MIYSGYYHLFTSVYNLPYFLAAFWYLLNIPSTSHKKTLIPLRLEFIWSQLWLIRCPCNHNLFNVVTEIVFYYRQIFSFLMIYCGSPCSSMNCISFFNAIFFHSNPTVKWICSTFVYFWLNFRQLFDLTCPPKIGLGEMLNLDWLSSNLLVSAVLPGCCDGGIKMLRRCPVWRDNSRSKSGHMFVL